MALRDRLKTKPLPESLLEIDGERFLVKGLKRLKRSELMVSSRDKDGKTDYRKLEGLMLSACVHDPELNTQLYLESEWKDWDEVGSVFTGPLIAECMRLNGMDNDDVGRIVKNSDTTDKQD